MQLLKFKTILANIVFNDEEKLKFENYLHPRVLKNNKNTEDLFL